MYRILLLHEMPESESRISDYLQLADYEVVEDSMLTSEYKYELRYFDLIILDYAKLETCLQVAKKLSEKTPTPIIVLSERKVKWDVAKLLRSGVNDYIEQSCWQGELLARVYAQIKYYERLTKPMGIIQVRELEINAFSRRVFLNNKEIELRLKEFEVLLYLAQHMNQVVSKQDIYKAVWKYDFSDGVYNSVAVHVKRIRGKIEKDINNPQYIETVWGVGYRFSS